MKNAAIAVSSMFLLITLAAADVRVETSVKVTGGPNGDRERKILISQRGNNVRVEKGSESPYYLFDGERKFAIDTAAKTYWVVNRTRSTGSASANDIRVEKSNEMKTIAGIETTRFDISGSLSVQPGSSGRTGAGSGRSGRFGGMRPRGGVKIGVSGELWGAELLKMTDLTLSEMMGDQGSGRGAMSRLGIDLSQIGAPLAGKIMLTPPSNPFTRSGKVMISFETSTVSKNPLSDDLFRIPEGYKLVEAPKDGRLDGFPGDGRSRS